MRAKARRWTLTVVGCQRDGRPKRQNAISAGSKEQLVGLATAANDVRQWRASKDGCGGTTSFVDMSASCCIVQKSLGTTQMGEPNSGPD